MNSSHHLVNQSISPSYHMHVHTELKAGTWCYLSLKRTRENAHTHTGTASRSCSWSSSGSQIQHQWGRRSWIKDICHHFLHFVSFLYYANLCVRIAAAKNRIRMSRMNDHCQRSNKCPSVEEKPCICTERRHIHKHKGLSLYTERQAHMLRAYAETCTLVKKLSLMNIHGH